MDTDSTINNNPDERFFSDKTDQTKTTPGSIHLTHGVMKDSSEEDKSV